MQAFIVDMMGHFANAFCPVNSGASWSYWSENFGV